MFRLHYSLPRFHPERSRWAFPRDYRKEHRLRCLAEHFGGGSPLPLQSTLGRFDHSGIRSPEPRLLPEDRVSEMVHPRLCCRDLLRRHPILHTPNPGSLPLPAAQYQLLPSQHRCQRCGFTRHDCHSVLLPPGETKQSTADRLAGTLLFLDDCRVSSSSILLLYVQAFRRSRIKGTLPILQKPVARYLKGWPEGVEPALRWPPASGPTMTDVTRTLSLLPGLVQRPAIRRRANNSLEPTWPAQCRGLRAILVLRWPGGSARGR